MFLSPTIELLSSEANVHKFRRTAFYKYHYLLFKLMLHLVFKQTSQLSMISSLFNDYNFKFVPSFYYMVIRIIRKYRTEGLNMCVIVQQLPAVNFDTGKIDPNKVYPYSIIFTKDTPNTQLDNPID